MRQREKGRDWRRERERERERELRKEVELRTTLPESSLPKMGRLLWLGEEGREGERNLLSPLCVAQSSFFIYFLFFNKFEGKIPLLSFIEGIEKPILPLFNNWVSQLKL